MGRKMNEIKIYSTRGTFKGVRFEIEIYFQKKDEEYQRGYYIRSTPIFVGRDKETGDETDLDKNNVFVSVIRRAERVSAELTTKVLDAQDKIIDDTLNEHYNILMNKGIINGDRTINEEILRAEEYADLNGFDSVAGYEEVKTELLEIVDFIKNAEKYKKMGAKLPKGILLYGPPGTGKTHMARALAKEANMKFIAKCGSEFMDKYVGTGAKKVRELFVEARENAPAIIFIDEVDTIGMKRDEDNTHQERIQALNQLLAELDGFKQDDNIIVLCATNRSEILDDALKRPGRLDKHIYVGNPDVKTRKELFQIHTENKPLNNDVDMDKLSKITHGVSCADISNICNQASIFAVREDREDVSQANFENAIETIIGGLKSQSKKLNDIEKKRVAFHEAGHAVANYLIGSTGKIQKVSIVPRGESLGCVIHLPDDEKYMNDKQDLLDEIKVLLAGRAAEEIILGSCSTGSSNDLEKSSAIAMNIVSRYGLGDDKSLFVISSNNIPNSLFAEYKSKAEGILATCYEEVKSFLEENLEFLEDVALELLDREELELKDIESSYKKTMPLASFVSTEYN
jgi:cell division protease FtsH